MPLASCTDANSDVLYGFGSCTHVHCPDGHPHHGRMPAARSDRSGESGRTLSKTELTGHPDPSAQNTMRTGRPASRSRRWLRRSRLRRVHFALVARSRTQVRNYSRVITPTSSDQCLFGFLGERRRHLPVYLPIHLPIERAPFGCRVSLGRGVPGWTWANNVRSARTPSRKQRGRSGSRGRRPTSASVPASCRASGSAAASSSPPLCSIRCCRLPPRRPRRPTGWAGGRAARRRHRQHRDRATSGAGSSGSSSCPRARCCR